MSFNILWMILAGVVYVYAIGIAGDIIKEINERDQNLDQQLFKLQKYLFKEKIPDELI